MDEKKSFLGKIKDKAAEQRHDLAEKSAAAREEAERERLARDQTIERVRRQAFEAGDLFEYAVETVRETLIGDKIKTSALQDLLNRYARDGWHVKSITETSVTGRVGPGGVSGLVVVFERRIFPNE